MAKAALSSFTFLPRPRGGAFSFALHLLRVQGFYFSTLHTAQYKRLQRILSCPCSYTANAVKQRTELYSGVSCDCARSAAHDTRPTQSAIILPVPCWSACLRLDTLNQYQISPPRRTLYRPAQTPYYNKAYKMVQQIASHASPAGQLLPCVDCWQVMTRCQQYRPGAPAEMSASSPVQG